MRTTFASNRGTLMGLGITSIVTLGMIMQLAGANLIEGDFGLRDDRILFSGAQKLFAMIIALGARPPSTSSPASAVSPESSARASASSSSFSSSVAPLIVVLLDELLQKGYGLGSGINLFIATNICESIFEGEIPTLFHLLFTWSYPRRALREAFWRDRLPNVMNLIATVVIFAVVTYLQGFRIEIPVKSNRFRGQRGTYPVKLFYTNNMPIMLQSALTSNVFIPMEASSELRTVKGIAYYMSPPQTLKETILDPIHTAVYITFMLFAGSGPRDVAKQLKDQQMTRCTRSSSASSPAFGGAILGLLSVDADLIGAIGSGTGIFMAVTTIYSYLAPYDSAPSDSNSGKLCPTRSNSDDLIEILLTSVL
ncbi:protein transport protein SEC61 subunit alpha [Ephemerocybe angulata]|uniref:Protein transport protein SEC61 subunit alpha n=1 Tax=Ephemerocybe angulata TaxID=980116 RepID=A0A8H6HQQ5_9AGAR|nr:protein transport protein SEC61 subunit alpha [Tulosesus angulatus]